MSRLPYPSCSLIIVLLTADYLFQGVSAVEAFHELLRQPSLSVMHPELNKPVPPVELCPILRALYKILILRLLHLQA